VNTLGVRKVASADSDPFIFYPGEQALVFRVLLARAGKREANEECETRATSPIALSRALRPFCFVHLLNAKNSAYSANYSFSVIWTNRLKEMVSNYR